jgi:hypothetical protein
MKNKKSNSQTQQRDGSKTFDKTDSEKSVLKSLRSSGYANNKKRKLDDTFDLTTNCDKLPNILLTNPELDSVSRIDGDNPKKKHKTAIATNSNRDNGVSGEKQSERSDSSMVPDKTSSADNNQGCGKIFLLNAYGVDEQDWECGRYCPVCKEIHLCPSCKEKKDNNSSKDKVSNDEGDSCLPASPLDAFSDEIKQEIMYKIINRKQRFKDNPKKYTGEDVLEAISLTAQKMQEITNQDITNFYKDKEINYADALLFKTAQNNFKAGQESQKQKMQKEIDELKKFYDIIFKRYEEAIIEQKEELRTSINTEWNEKVKKLKEEIEAEIKVAEKYIKEHTKHSNAEQSILIMRMVLMSINRIFGGKE